MKTPAQIKITILYLRAVALLCVAGSFSTVACVGNNPRQTVRLEFRHSTVRVEYGRPSLRGRDPLKLIEPGQLWRLGADAPTTIEADRDLDFGGVRVPKGRHILIVRFIQPGSWSLVVSTTPAIDYAPSARIAEVLMRFEGSRHPVQELEIHLSSAKGHGAIKIAWGAYRLSAQFVPAQ
ncbi:MAG TPA: DUF2911 domain-containing protein [Terriglobia bacterium]|nr:DUF2911 domain-containing protein [Terriglobia bacterium]